MDELLRLWRDASPAHRRRFMLGLACSVLVMPFEALTPWLLEKVVATLEMAGELHAEGRLVPRVLLVALGLPLLGLFKGAAQYGTRYFMARGAQGVLADLRSRLYAVLLHRPVGEVVRQSTGEQSTRITSDVQRIETGITFRVSDLVIHVPTALALAAYMWLVSWRLAAIVTVLLPFAGLLVRRWGRRIKAASRRAQAENAGLASVIVETMTGIRVVKAFRGESRERARFDAINDQLRRAAMQAQRTVAASSPILDTLSAIVIGGLVAITAYEIVRGSMTVAEFVAFAGAMSMVYRSVKRVSTAYTELQNTTASAQRCFDVLDDPAVEPGGRVEVAGLERAIEFRGVDFAYGDRPVLVDFDLTLRRGEVVALVGGSGSGKTTVTALLLRFWDATAGTITWDGVDVREIVPHSLRSQVALVTQDAFVFDDTVTRNVAYGDPSPDLERVRAAARAAHADGFVSELEHGYETKLGPLGSRLSGGQRQRIALARALYADAPVIVLDEATSSLDSHSESLVQDALATLVRDRTVLVVAHRLSTVRDADRIVVMSEGRIVEQGSHRELIARAGAYHQLYRLQAESA